MTLEVAAGNGVTGFGSQAVNIVSRISGLPSTRALTLRAMPEPHLLVSRKRLALNTLIPRA
jgi:hypothetical protein